MVAVSVIFVFYLLLLVVFLIGWKRAMQRQTETGRGREPLISVVIAARDEELTIGTLLVTLSEQEYKKFEVIVVNDDSRDETLWVVSNFAMKNLHVIPSKGKGKKSALTIGIRAARGSIIVTTDADCLVEPEWLKLIREQFRDPTVMMAFGGVRLRGNDSFFSSLQEMEFSSLIGSGASTAALGVPTLCNGANLAFRKRVFLQVKGYQDNLEIASGDDEFLMRKIQKFYPGSVRFIHEPRSVVTTPTEPTLESFMHQRIRWASKWRYNSSILSKSLAVAVVALQITFIANWFLVFSPVVAQSLFLITLKMILEAAFLLQVCRFLGTRWNWLAFFALQVFYPLYVIAVAGASFFMPFKWKNRIFKHKEKPVGR